MSDDQKIRENRLGMIYQIARLIKDYADLAEVEWKQNF